MTRPAAPPPPPEDLEVSPLRKRAQEISAEYWEVRDGGQSERVAAELAEAYHAVACSKWRVAGDHLENEIILFRVVVARLRESVTDEELGWSTAPLDVTDPTEWHWRGDGPVGIRQGTGDGWWHHHPDGRRWVHVERKCEYARAEGAEHE